MMDLLVPRFISYGPGAFDEPGNLQPRGPTDRPSAAHAHAVCSDLLQADTSKIHNGVRGDVGRRIVNLVKELKGAGQRVHTAGHSVQDTHFGRAVRPHFGERVSELSVFSPREPLAAGALEIPSGDLA